MEEERGLYQLAQMVLLSGIATVTAVTLLLGSIRLAVLLLILPVLAFPLAWLLFAAVFGQRTLGITQVRRAERRGVQARSSPAAYEADRCGGVLPFPFERRPGFASPPDTCYRSWRIADRWTTRGCEHGSRRRFDHRRRREG
eukprot:scaffold170281_cov29-Tisochrysis_lutea.AAC.4